MQNVQDHYVMLLVDHKQWILYGIYGKTLFFLYCFPSLKFSFRNKGVKVVLDVPDTMWDAPSAEITQLKKYVRSNNLLIISFIYSI